MDPTPPSSRAIRGRWLQFSLRTLLALVILASLGFGWIGVEVGRLSRRGAALAAIEAARGQIEYDDQGRTVAAEWLRIIVGDAAITRVTAVMFFRQPQVSDEDLKHVRLLSELETLVVIEGAVTDRGLTCLTGLGELQGLRISDTQITGAGLAPLLKLPRLRDLDLSDNPIGDDGLAVLAKIPALRMLELQQTRVTGAGLAHLAGLDNLERLNLNGNRVSDEGAPHLMQLKQLRYLYVCGTQISAKGERRLREALPSCVIDWWWGGAPW